MGAIRVEASRELAIMQRKKQMIGENIAPFTSFYGKKGKCLMF